MLEVVNVFQKRYMKVVYKGHNYMYVNMKLFIAISQLAVLLPVPLSVAVSVSSPVPG